ncbi:MAG: hypothetical protein U1F76_18170 [Candidatus Competibacteraceae bacterium]
MQWRWFTYPTAFLSTDGYGGKSSPPPVPPPAGERECRDRREQPMPPAI